MPKTSFELKLERADEHLNTLENIIHAWFLADPYNLIDDLDSNAGDNVARIKISPIPDKVAILIGDCLYNLRASLDHLVHALAWKFRGSLSHAESRETAFPIFKTFGGWHSRRGGKRQIKYLSPVAQAIVQGLQPYLTGNKAESHFLWLLNELQNIDKHRALLATATAQVAFQMSNPSGITLRGGGFVQMTVVHTAETYTEIARYRVFDPKDGHRVKVNVQPTFQIKFQQRPAVNLEVVSTLHTVRDGIANLVFPLLRPLL
jgi:hypothetical protein